MKTATKRARLTAFLLIPILLIGIIFVAPAAKRTLAEEAVHTYTESLDEIVNPATGFYKRVGVRLFRGSSALAPGVLNNISAYAKNYGIIQLCFDLSAFSGAVNKESDYEIDGDALSAVESVFAALRTNKVGAIIRFDYDRDGVGGDREPSVEMLEKHIQKISTAVTEYSDVILGVESGMIGKWGEQHSTTLAGTPHAFYVVVETWLRNTPEKIGITVRRPLYFTYWANEKYDLDTSVLDLEYFDSAQYVEAKRVGVYNDGYLGSYNDLGTFTGRRIETAFIGRQAENTYYGGELVADSQTGLLGDYNSVSFLEVEGFRTHTSYLNIDWNDKVFAEYKKRTYDGTDELYKGKTTEFTFVKNRLGYRFYLSSSTDSLSDETDELNLKFTVANAGFARLLRPARSELVFKSATHSATIDCTDGVNLTQVPSAGDKTFELSVAIPEELPDDEYEVYLRFYTEYGAEIKMANDTSVCAPDREGVKVATVQKSAPVELTDITVTAQPTKKTYTVGDTLDLAGLTVTAVYSDNSTESVTVTTDMLSDYDMTAAGAYHVKITYEGKTATFDITVKNPNAVLSGLTAVYSGKQYYTSGNFDSGELTVKALYSDGSEITVSDYTLSDFDMTAGVKTVTVTYTDEGVTKTSEFTFTVIAATLTCIEVTTMPAKTVYGIGEILDITGLVVTASYSDGTTGELKVTNEMLSGYDTTAEGIQTVQITYDGKTATYNIIVEEEQAPPDGGDNNKKFLRDNAVLLGCVAAAAASAAVIIVIIAVILKRKKK